MRIPFILAAVVAFAAPARADVPLPPSEGHLLAPPGAMLDAAKEAEFWASVAIGDRERAAGHVPEAAIAYARAINIRQDHLIGGRLGVLLVEAEKYQQAADLLLLALKHARTTTAERETFFRAYETARMHGAWVAIVVSETGAHVALDDKPQFTGGYGAFSIFVATGEHRATAVLEGFHDATVPFTVRAGEDMRVVLELRPLLKRLERHSEPPPHPSTNVVGDPNYSKKEDPFYEPPKPDKPQQEKDTRFSLNAGVVTVFGVASWMPAVGPVVGGAWRPNQYFSLGLEGRAAWLTVGVAGEPISAMTAGGLVSACGHVKWFFGCALGHVGVVRDAASGGTFIDTTHSTTKIGGGGRFGARVRLSRSFGLTGAIDAMVLNSGIRVGLEGTVLVDQPPIMLGSHVLAGWEL